MPEYSEGYGMMHSSKTYAVICLGNESANPSHSMTQRVVSIYFLRAYAKISI
jgi:hypothetical protein